METNFINDILEQLKNYSKEEGFIDTLKNNIIEKALQTEKPKDNLLDTMSHIVKSGLNLALTSDKEKNKIHIQRECKVVVNGSKIEIKDIFKNETGDIIVSGIDQETKNNIEMKLDDLDVLSGQYYIFNTLIEDMESKMNDK